MRTEFNYNFKIIQEFKPDELIEEFVLNPSITWDNILKSITERYEGQVTEKIDNIRSATLKYVGTGFTNNAIDSLTMKLNDMRYYEPKLEISVFVKNSNAKIIVKDNGMGLYPEDKEIIFKEKIGSQKMYKNNLWGGAGLFLYSAHERITNLSGIINYESKGHMQGAKFWCELNLINNKKS
jgi:signal transduction histidine kinase